MLHGLAELGEGGEWLLDLLTLDLSGLLLLLAKAEWKGRLALLSLGLGGGLDSGLSSNSLSWDGGGAGDAGGEGFGLLNGRDNWGLGAGHNLVILSWDSWDSIGSSLLGSKSGLEVEKGRVALGSSWAGLWDSSLLNNCGLSSRGLNGGGSLLNNCGLDSSGLSDRLLLGDSLVSGRGLFLLAAQVESTEDGVALAASGTALGAGLLLLLSLILLVLGLGLLGGDSLLLLLVLDLGDNSGRLAQSSKLLLVTLAASDGLGTLLGLGRLFLEGSDPVVAVNKVGGLENVLLAVADERELNGAVFLDVGDVGLRISVNGLSVVGTVGLSITYKVDEANWGALLSGLLVKVKETLAGLGRPGSVVIANLWLLATEVVRKALHLDGISSEPEEALLETSKLPDMY